MQLHRYYFADAVMSGLRMGAAGINPLRMKQIKALQKFLERTK